MGRRQRIGNLDGVPQCLIQWEQAAAQPRSERLALDQLHHEILMLEAADVGSSDVMQRADVRVIEPRDGARFALEPLAAVGLSRDVFGQDLQGDVAVQPRVPRAEHFPHAAGADRGNDFVRA